MRKALILILNHMFLRRLKLQTLLCLDRSHLLNTNCLEASKEASVLMLDRRYHLDLNTTVILHLDTGLLLRCLRRRVFPLPGFSLLITNQTCLSRLTHHLGQHH